MPRPGGSSPNRYNSQRNYHRNRRHIYGKAPADTSQSLGLDQPAESFWKSILLPLIMLVLAAVLILGVWFSFGSPIAQAAGGNVLYDETPLGRYAEEQYKKEFSFSGGYEDNVLLVVFVEDTTYQDYAYITWTGNHIRNTVNRCFGNHSSALGQAMSSALSGSSYEGTLDTALTQVIQSIEQDIAAQSNGSPFLSSCPDQHAQKTASHLTNKTEMMLDESAIHEALQSFDEATGIPIVLVIEDIDDVFEPTMPIGDVLLLIGAGILIVISLIMIILTVMKRKSGSSGNKRGNDGNRYNRNEGGNYRRSYH